MTTSNLETIKQRVIKMSRSEIFKAAHKIAKATVAIVGDYIVAMSLALKEVYASMKKSVVEKIKELSGVSSVSQWNDRYYVNLRGNGGNFKGERTSKVWFKEGGELNVELGKGLCSSEWHEQLEQVKSVFN